MRSVRRVLLVLSIPFLSLAQTDPRIPAEVRYKSGYINRVPKPPDIADTRVPGYKHAQVEIARTQLACHVDGNDAVLNNDRADVRGGL